MKIPDYLAAYTQMHPMGTKERSCELRYRGHAFGVSGKMLKGEYVLAFMNHADPRGYRGIYAYKVERWSQPNKFYGGCKGQQYFKIIE